jgi:hypothetical protein
LAAGAHRGFELNRRPPKQRREGGRHGVAGGDGRRGGGPTMGLGGGVGGPTEVASGEVVAERQGRVAVTTTGIAVQAGARVRAGGGGRAGGLRGRVAVGGGGVNGRAGGSSVFWLSLTETVPRGWDSFVNFRRGLSAS